MKARMFIGVLLVAACVMVAGCSQYQCYYGACRSIGPESVAIRTTLANQNATSDELTAALRRVADYSMGLYDNTRPLCGAYANATYHALLVRLVGDSESAAARAESGLVGITWKREALAGLASVLDELQLASVGRK